MTKQEKMLLPPSILKNAYALYEKEGYEATNSMKMLLKQYLENYPYGIRIFELMVDDFIHEYHGREIDWSKYT